MRKKIVMKFLSAAFLITFLSSSANGLSCLPCDERNCTLSECENSGYTPDICGCCDVCAKRYNQTCGGLWGMEGTCDKNLTCNGTTDFSFFVTGECSDAECLAIVDFIFVLDGSFAFGEMGFINATRWSKEITRLIYEMYGACAHVEIMQYAGTGGEIELVYPMNLETCTNNIDCVEKMLNDFMFLNLAGKETFKTLFEIAGRFSTSSRHGRAQKVIIIATYGDNADSSEAQEWLLYSSAEMIVTYATSVGATWEELVNITGSMDRVIDPVDSYAFIDQIWHDTVDTSDNCPPGEMYHDCLPNCDITCRDPNPACGGGCRGSGCDCMKEYARREDGVCVPVKDCNKTVECPSGEVFKQCSSPCERTCANPNPICIERCDPPQCQCVDGYVRHEGICIPVGSCPTTVECPKGEEFKTCSSNCEPTCTNPDPVCIQVCGSPACQCVAGYAREGGVCIPISKCPQTASCEEGEEFRQCSSCEPTCYNPTPICPAVCGPPRCQCKTGYVREKNRCIRQYECEIVTCDYPKIPEQCASTCQPTCDRPKPWDCAEGCSDDPCVCPQEHVLLSDTDRRCVHQYQCPVKTCTQDCPMIQYGISSMAAAAAWHCYLRYYRCLTFNWKLAMEEWWYTSGCYQEGGAVESKWRQLFEDCPGRIDVTCKDGSQYVHEVDVFGCGMGRCRDGGYQDKRQLMKLWFNLQIKHQQKLEIYKEATRICQRSSGCKYN